MTIDELIKLLRSNREGSHRKKVTETIHGIETFSLGTDIDAGTLKEDDLKGGNFKFELKDGKLVLRK